MQFQSGKPSPVVANSVSTDNTSRNRWYTGFDGDQKSTGLEFAQFSSFAASAFGKDQHQIARLQCVNRLADGIAVRRPASYRKG